MSRRRSWPGSPTRVTASPRSPRKRLYDHRRTPQPNATTLEEFMPEAVIISPARTPIGRAFRGAFNNTHGAVLGGHVIQNAVERAGIDPAEVDDVVMGCGLPERATGQNIARVAVIRPGLPVTPSAKLLNRLSRAGVTANNGAAPCGVSREKQDEYALESQKRTAAGQRDGRFDGEIVPLPSVKKLVDKDTKAESFEAVTLKKDEGNRADT